MIGSPWHAASYMQLAAEIMRTSTPAVAAQSNAEPPLARSAPEAAETLKEYIRDLKRPAKAQATKKSSGAQQQKVVLTFRGYEGKQLQIAGEFNKWVPDQNVTTRRKKDTLQKILHIPPGTYQYRLIVDGEWRDDPTNPERIANDVGGHNSLLRVMEERELAEA